MERSIESIISCLKGSIDKNGPSYLTDEPYKVYNELIESDATDRKTASAILHLLVSGLLENINQDNDVNTLSEAIEMECCLNKKMADRLAHIIVFLYSDKHKKEWKNKELEGLRMFLAEEFVCTWKGFAVWDATNGTIDCHYEAKLILSPVKEISTDEELAYLLKKNPFITKEDIHNFFVKRLQEYLDYKFEEYCTEDDYYQPVVEDFGINLEYDLSDWCKENGFEFISLDGDGRDDGYEPKSSRGWY